MGDAYRQKGEIQTAIKYFERVLTIVTDQKNKIQETIALMRLGTAYTEIKEFNIAIIYFQEAFENGEIKQQIDALVELGIAYRQTHQIQTAIEHFEKALGITSKQEDLPQHVDVLLSLGDAYKENGQVHKAISFFQDGLEIAQQRESKQQETIALLKLGTAYGDIEMHTYKRVRFKQQLSTSKKS